ncbi:sigma-54-dependent Fis family transcriptional regulator [Bacillus taeanensis]|uniref:Sigma-54-dependent Fis family transcriptional regulator n=1 Tax=Bacillus taeanensis TaxID=273032 RepID=A0A366XPX3_9BACI|nr:PrpR N-terminal domain-containing protein [Bacillus taeanensis]RBW67957.1 sigma-54-dependent Fis family transcriptional regulator [Bacillus taeanensis]
MIKALVVAPYEGLFEIMKEIAQDVEDFQFHIKLGNLYEGIEIAKDAEKNGYNVIISRGGTASMIQEVVSIPVIDIQVSGYDVLRILTLVKGFPGKAAIVGFPNISHGAATICNLLDLDINTMTITKDIEVEERLKNLKKQGYEVVIGDVVTVETAKQLGLNGVLITSGKEAVMEALDEARRVYRLFSKLHEEVSLYQSIIDGDDRAVAVINKEGKIIYSNALFHTEMNKTKLENLPDVKEIVRQTFLKGKKQTKILTLDEQLWKLTTCCSQQSVILYFEKAFRNQTEEQAVKGDAYAVEIQTAIPYVIITGKSEQIQHVIKQVDKYSQMDEPLWIMSEAGNGKDVVVQSIYLKSKRSSEPFITLNCDLLKKEQVTSLINENFFQNYANGTVYLKRIDCLDSYSQKELYHFIKNENGKMPRWLMSSNDTVEQKISEGTFDRDLFYLLTRLVIHIPPLRERGEDIENLVHVFISEFHTKYGKQIVGIRQDALQQLMDYDWPGNVDQLKQVIEQLVLQSHSYYLEKEEVESALYRLKQQSKANRAAVNNMDISGTLKEIEKKIITKVLEEEEMNQSKAAKRLGINRSTLWRKLK